MGTAQSRHRLITDSRGGTDSLELLILVALIAMAGVAGVFWFGQTTSARMNAHASSVDSLAARAPGWSGDSDTELPEPPSTWTAAPAERTAPTRTALALGSLREGLASLRRSAANLGYEVTTWLPSRAAEWALEREVEPDWDHAGSAHIVHPDGTVEPDLPLADALDRVRDGRITSVAINGSLHNRDSARTSVGARARHTGQPQLLIYYPQGFNYFNGNEHRDQVRETIAQVRDAAAERDRPLSWSCHSHACHFVADELRDAEGQTLDAYAPAQRPFGEQQRMWVDAIRNSRLDRLTIYRGSRDSITRIGGGGYRDDSGGDCAGLTCGEWNDEVREAVEANPNAEQVVIEGAEHSFIELLDEQCAMPGACR